MKGGIHLDQNPNLLTSEIVQMLVSSMTNSGQRSMTELEAERFLNAIARAQSGVPTGPYPPNAENR
jgi:hypothetical protein